MGSDVRIRTELSELTEFPASLRCEACQTHHRQCLMRESDGRCVQCGHAGDDCFFTRVVKFKAPRASFRWDTLLGLGEETATVSIDVHGDGSPRYLLLDIHPSGECAANDCLETRLPRTAP
jgi:hypothetical protein